MLSGVKSKAYLCCLVVLAGLLLGSAATATVAADIPTGPGSATKNGITITPSQKELVVSSGLINAYTNVVVTNHTGKSLDATVRLVDFKGLNDSGGLAFSQGSVSTDKYGLANWMELPNGNSVTLPDGQATTIPVLVVNRFDLTPGGHYGAIVVTFGASDDATGNQAKFKQELASLLFVKKLGGEDYSLQLRSFVTDRSGGIPSSASLGFKAAGNVYVVPRGYVTVTNKKGVVLAKGIINPESSIVLPGSSRQFAVPIQKIPIQKVQTSKDLKAYKITAYYRYDGQKDFDVSSITISQFPWRLLAVIGIVITGVIGISMLRRAQRIKLRHK